MTKKLLTIAVLLGALVALTACNSPTPQTDTGNTTASTAVVAEIEATGDAPVSQVGAATDTGTVEVVTASYVAATDDSMALTDNQSGSYSYAIVDTGQAHCYDDSSGIACPTGGEFYGQDAQYAGTPASYVDNGDGTVTDLNTGLMWIQTPLKENYNDAVAGADSFSLAGYDDWRLPTIKELYSLMGFNGSVSRNIPYIDTDYFEFQYGDESAGERQIDAQYWSSTVYVGTVMNGQQSAFGVNFADGRIKSYPTNGGRNDSHYVLYVRGNTEYGENAFVASGDGTVTDTATGLTWQQGDSVQTLDWGEALTYCENLEDAGYSDWRLPNAKELQSTVDYSRSPQTTGTAAIDPVFSVTELESWYWSSTTHLDVGASNAVYVAFGQAFGLPNGNLVDVHGAGAQRSDPKSGDPAQYSDGRGSAGQEDQVRIYNYARCVRGGVSSTVIIGGAIDQVQGGPPTGGAPNADAEAGQGNEGQFAPPQQAIDACVGLAVSSSCTVDTPRGDLNGTCNVIPTGDLACVPEGNNGPPGGGPP